MKNLVSIPEVFVLAWQLFVKNIWLSVGWAFSTIVLSFLIAVFLQQMPGSLGVALACFFLLSFWYTLSTKMFFAILDEEPFTIENLIPNFTMCVKYFSYLTIFSMVLSSISMLELTYAIEYLESKSYISPKLFSDEKVQSELFSEVLLLVLLINYILWGFRFFFAAYFVVDDEEASMRAFRNSFAITKTNYWVLIRLVLLVILMNTVGILLFGIGLLFTMSISSFVLMIAYRQMRNQEMEEQETVC